MCVCESERARVCVCVAVSVWLCACDCVPLCLRVWLCVCEWDCEARLQQGGDTSQGRCCLSTEPCEGRRQTPRCWGGGAHGPGGEEL